MHSPNSDVGRRVFEFTVGLDVVGANVGGINVGEVVVGITLAESIVGDGVGAR